MPKLSPHVSIYKFPLTAVSSILNRVNGVVISNFFIFSGICCAFNQEKYVKSLLKDKYIQTCVTAPFVYHTLGGIRHILWDKYPTYFLNNKATHKSSIAIFALTFPISYGIVKNI